MCKLYLTPSTEADPDREERRGEDRRKEKKSFICITPTKQRGNSKFST